MLSFERGVTPAPPRRRGVIRRVASWVGRLGVGKGPGTLDLVAVLAMIALAGLGVLNLYAVGGRTLAEHQIGTVIAGLVLMIVLSRMPAKSLPVLAVIAYVVAVLLLIVVAVAGEVVFGARRWLAVGSVTFQPSEMAKISLLLALSCVLASSRPAWRRFVYAIMLAAVPIALVVLEPDLSTAALLLSLTVALLILARVSPRYVVPLFGVVVVAAPLAVSLLRPYQLERLRAFTSGGGQTGSGYAIQQAHIALASGGLFGRIHDPLHGLLAAYLPAAETDFALASLVEQWGLLAGVIAVLAALILVWRLALAARAPRYAAGGLVCGGLAVLIGIETVVSLGGNLGLLPVAGVPFPLLSYGGTAVIAHMSALGIALGARRDGARRQMWASPRWHLRHTTILRAVALGITAALVAFTAYGWRLQQSQGDELRAAGKQQMTRCFRIPSARGQITDRHGAPLAVDVALSRVVVIPALVRADPQTVSRLATLLGEPLRRLRATLAKAPATGLPVAVADVSSARGRRVAAAGIPAVYVEPRPRRVYPTGALLGPVLGFVGVATPADLVRFTDLSATDTVGRAGIEQQYDAVLRGVDGVQCVYVNPAGVPVALGGYRAPVTGANLRLSIDLGLQRELTARLAQAHAMAANQGAVAAAVAMDPRNGQVLAIASLPSYDNNLYGPPINEAALNRASNAIGSPMLEHVTQAVAPPGSTFKLVVAAANMAHPAFSPDEIVPTGGSFTLYGHTFNNWGDLPPQNFVQAIAWSNDVYFYKLAWALGADAVTSTARQFGVGQPTGIDLPGESSGYLGTPENIKNIGAVWYAGSTVLLGIGQGYLDVTPLQDARWTAAVATGRLVTPRLALATGNGTGSYALLPSGANTRLPFANVLGPVQAGMRAAVTGGTASLLWSLPQQIGAKTGTAEDSSAPGGIDDWMSATGPMDNPQIEITAMVQGVGEGATRAGPVVRDALQYFFAHDASASSWAHGGG